eukprot:tig00000851_g4919.t1
MQFVEPQMAQGAAEVFVEKVLAYMEDIGKPIIKIPTLGHKELDLFTLYQEVTSRGGLKHVVEAKLWQEVSKALDLPSTCTDSGYRLRKHYQQCLFDYERRFFFGIDDSKLELQDGGSGSSSKAARPLKRTASELNGRDRPIRSSAAHFYRSEGAESDEEDSVSGRGSAGKPASRRAPVSPHRPPAAPRHVHERDVERPSAEKRQHSAEKRQHSTDAHAPAAPPCAPAAGQQTPLPVPVPVPAPVHATRPPRPAAAQAAAARPAAAPATRPLLGASDSSDSDEARSHKSTSTGASSSSAGPRSPTRGPAPHANGPCPERTRHVNLGRLSRAALERYRKTYKLKPLPEDASKEELAKSAAEHFARLVPLDERGIIEGFLHRLKNIDLHVL